MKHTKGPWEIQDESANGLFRVIPSNKKEGLAITGNLNDARLIAAAPELLTSLKHAFYLLKENGFDNHDEKIKFIADAIAKAEGKES